MHRWVEIVIAGAVSGGAYPAAPAGDLRLAKNCLDDRVLTGRLLPVAPERVPVVGTVLYVDIADAFSAVFRSARRDRLRGPMWWRGVQASAVQSLAVYPLALLENFHSAVREGRLDSYQSARAMRQQIWRRVVSGAALDLFTLAHD